MWNQVVKTIQNVSIKHLGIPTVYGLDQMHGTTYSAGGTLFPGAINMAATFNRDLVYKMGEIVAYETRACNVPGFTARVSTSAECKPGVGSMNHLAKMYSSPARWGQPLFAACKVIILTISMHTTWQAA